MCWILGISAEGRDGGNAVFLQFLMSSKFFFHKIGRKISMRDFADHSLNTAPCSRNNLDINQFRSAICATSNFFNCRFDRNVLLAI